MEEEGDGVVVHGLRGRASNRRIAEAVERRALEIVQQPEWHDFGPTFASEQLAKQHGLEVSKETLRKMDDGRRGVEEPVARSAQETLLARAAELLWRAGADPEA